MDIKNLFKKYTPNPLSSETTLPDLSKKSEVIVETFSFAGIIRNIIFLVIAGFVLSSFFKVPANVIGILIGFEILSSLLIAYVKYRKIKSLSSITPAADGRSFKKIVVTREYYALVTGIVGLITSVISVGLILLFFGQQLSDLFVQNSVIKNLNIKYVIFFFVGFRLLDLLVKLIRYQIIKGVEENENLAQVNQSFSLINKKFELITFVPGTSVLLVALFLIGIPGYIILIFFGFVLLMVIFSIVEIKRISKVDLSIQTPAENVKNLTLIPGEKIIIGTIFGIMNLKRTGFAFLGVGKTTKPENTLMITDSRLLFVQIPIPGSNKIIDGTVYGDMNFFWNRGEIKEKGQQMIEGMSIDEIVKQYGIDAIAFDEIASLTLKKMEFYILTNTNQQYKYLFMDREYVEPLKQWLKEYLKEKFVETD